MVLAVIQDGGHFSPQCWQVYKMAAIFLHGAGRYARWRPFSSTVLAGIQDGGHFSPRCSQVYKMTAIFLLVLAFFIMVAIFTHNADRHKKAVILLLGAGRYSTRKRPFFPGAGMF